jgi:hypothetical protein
MNTQEQIEILQTAINNLDAKSDANAIAHIEAVIENMTKAKFFVSQDTNSVYWLEGDNLGYAPIMRDGSFTIADGDIVDEPLVSDEHIYAPESQNYLTLGDVFAQARKALA